VPIAALKDGLPLKRIAQWAGTLILSIGLIQNALSGRCLQTSEILSPLSRDARMPGSSDFITMLTCLLCVEVEDLGKPAHGEPGALARAAERLTIKEIKTRLSGDFRVARDHFTSFTK
jgi:hypothetical protein